MIRTWVRFAMGMGLAGLLVATAFHFESQIAEFWFKLPLTRATLEGGGAPKARSITKAEVQARMPKWLNDEIPRNGQALKKFTLPRGMFLDHLSLDPRFPAIAAGGYNVFHHAEALNALVMFEPVRPDPKLKSFIAESVRYLVMNHLRWVGPPPKAAPAPTPPRRLAESRALRGHSGRASRKLASLRPAPKPAPVTSMAAAWYVPEDPKQAAEARFSSVATDAALEALLNAEKLQAGLVSPELLTSMGNFLLHLEKRNGDFDDTADAKGVASKLGRYQMASSRNAYALLLLYEHDQSPRWLKGALLGLRYLAASRDPSAGYPDSYYLIAASKLFKLSQRTEVAKAVPPQELAQIYQQAIGVARASLKGQILGDPSHALYGSYNKTAATLETALRLQGLHAVMTILQPADLDLLGQIWTSTQAGATFLLRHQIKRGFYAGAYPRLGREGRRGRLSRTEYLQARSEIRVDAVAESLVALLQHRALTNAMRQMASNR